MTKADKQQQEAAREALRAILTPGMTVYTSLHHVSASGMTRAIGVHAVIDGEIRWLSRYAQQATGYGWDEKRETVKVTGCGMDMGFEVVYNLSRVLFPDGFKVEGRGRNGDASGWDKDGGYALNHRWI